MEASRRSEAATTHCRQHINTGAGLLPCFGQTRKSRAPALRASQPLASMSQRLAKTGYTPARLDAIKYVRSKRKVTAQAVPSFRAFVGFKLNEVVQEQLTCRLTELREQNVADGRFEPQENLHVTLKYIGIMPVDESERLLENLQEAVGNTRPISIEVAGFGCFLRSKKVSDRKHIAWAGVKDSAGELSELAGAVDTVVSKLALAKPEKRAFSAHVTVARDASNWPQLMEGCGDSFGSMTVQQITLFKSEGGNYIAMGHAQLKNDPND